MSKYIEYSAYTWCISLYIYWSLTCDIKSLLNVPKISHISQKISRVSRFPAKYPDSRNKFVFLPKQPLLELSPPVNVNLCTINLCCFSHLRLNRFNFLTVQGIYAESLPHRFFFNTQDFAFAPLEKMSTKKSKDSVSLAGFRQVSSSMPPVSGRQT